MNLKTEREKRNERNAGRKPIYDEPLERVKVGLTPYHRAIAQRLGKNLSDGIRKALENGEDMVALISDLIDVAETLHVDECEPPCAELKVIAKAKAFIEALEMAEEQSDG